jgi:hypothetical protein
VRNISYKFKSIKIMKYSISVAVLFLSLTISFGLLAQGIPPLPAVPGSAGQATKVGPQWTLLSDKDNLLFEAKKGDCDGHGMLMMKVQNKSAKEVHVFVSLSIQDGMRSPQQVLILKGNETVEIGCRPTVPFMPLPLRDGQEPAVTLEYNINRLASEK